MASHFGGAYQSEKDQQQVNDKLTKILAHVAEMKLKREKEEAAARFKYHTDKYGKENYLPLIDEPLKNGGGSPRNYKSAIVDQKEDKEAKKLLTSTAALFEAFSNNYGENKPTTRLTSSSTYGIGYTMKNGAVDVENGNDKKGPTPPSPRRVMKPVEATSLAIGENEEDGRGFFVGRSSSIPLPPSDEGQIQGSGRFTHSPRVQKHIQQQQQLAEQGAMRQNYERYEMLTSAMTAPRLEKEKDPHLNAEGIKSSSSGKKTAAAPPVPPAPSSSFKMGSPRNGFISKTTFSTAFDHCYHETAKEISQGGPTPSPRQQLKARALDSRLPAPQSTIKGSSNPTYKNLITEINSQKEAHEIELENLRTHVINQLRQYRTDDDIEKRVLSQRDYDFAQGVKSSLSLESDNILKRKRGIRVFRQDEFEVSPVADLQYQKMRSPKEGDITRRKHIATQDNLTLKLTKKKNQIEDNSIFAPKNVYLRTGLASIETKGGSPRRVAQQ